MVTEFHRGSTAHARVSKSPAFDGIAQKARLRWRSLVLAAAAVLGIGWAVQHFLLSPHHARTVVQTSPIGISKVSYANLHVVLQGLGTVTPVSTVTVQTQINGQLTEVAYKEGQLVKKGDFLAQIDPRPYEVALQQAQGALAHDTGLLNQAKSDLARYQALDKVDAIAKQVLADQEFLVQQDIGTVTQDQAAVNSAKLNLTYCHIVAPVTGRTGLRLVDPGNYVQTSSSTGLVVLTVLQPITVIFVLPEDDIPALAQQMQSGATLSVAVFDRTNTKQLATGVLTTLDNTVDTTTGTVKLRATFPNNDLSLFPNEFVNARLLLQTIQHVPAVPVRAVQTGAPGTFVYVVRPNKTVHVQVVRTGVTDGDRIQVLSGLKPGDAVVVDGVALLHEGSKVRIASEGRGRSRRTNDGPGAPPGEQSGRAEGSGEGVSHN